MKKYLILFITFLLLSNVLKADGLYFGYYIQVGNVDFLNYINSPLSFLVENNCITYVNPKGYYIIYYTPASYLVSLSYGELLNPTVPISLGETFNFSLHYDYYYNGRMVLTGDYYFEGTYYLDHIAGNLNLITVSFDPQFNCYQGNYHFVYDCGIISGNNKKYIGHYVQKNNGNWYGFINAPFNITMDGDNITFWNELNQDIVYINSSFNLLKLPIDFQFTTPIQTTDNIPFHIEFTKEYEENGEIVIIGNFKIDGTRKQNYIFGSMEATFVSLDLSHTKYQGTYFWDFEAGIEVDIICEYSIKPEKQSVPSSGGTFYFQILTRNECFWEIETDSAWITLASGSTGNGDFLTSFAILPNTNQYPRTGNIYLKDSQGTVVSTLEVSQSILDCPKNIALFDLPGTPLEISLSQGYAYIASYEGGLRIVDVSNPSSPFEVGFFDTYQYSTDLAVSGNYVYLTDLDDGLLIIDISNPSSPQLISQYSSYGTTSSIAYIANYCFITKVEKGLDIIDVSNPIFPQKIGGINFNGNVIDIFIFGNYAYLADRDFGLRIIDISNPYNPQLISTYPVPGQAYGVFVKGNLCFLADGDLRIIDVSNPLNPIEINSYYTLGFAYNVKIVENFAYIADGDFGILILEISNPLSIKEIGIYNIRGVSIKTTILGNYCYVADCYGSMEILNISCKTNCYTNLGDITENGLITSFDSSYLLQYLVGAVELSETQKCKADVNISGAVSSLDSSLILKCSANLCSNLPSEFFLSCYNHNNCN